MDNAILISIISGCFLIIGGMLSYFANKQVNKSNASYISVQTYNLLSKRVDELEKRDEEKEKRIDELDAELRKFRKAYERALSWIKVTVSPDTQIPDFFIDTGKLNK